MKHAHVDWESYSSVDIRSGGAFRYVDSPDFEIMLAAYSADGRAVKVFDLKTEAHDDPLYDPHDVNQLPPELRTILTNPDYLIYAHNAQFERLCIRKMWGLDLPISRFRCVMVHGLYCGLPGSLSDVGAALHIPEDKRKLAAGKALINLFCKPVSRKDGRTRIMPWDEPEKWELFKEYCAQDVVAEMEHERLLSDTPVPPSVWREYEMDQRINDIGVRADLDLVDGAIAIAAETEELLLAEAQQVCGLDNPKSVSQLLAWIQKEMPDEELTDLRKDTVSDLLGSGTASGAAQRMLEIRQLISKTSTKKYDAVRNTVCSDGRIHGLFQFYGANRTGRFAGRLVQVQNLPRNSMDELDAARRYVLKHDRAALDFLYENVPDTLSQLIRTIFIPSPGHKLIVSDFSAIEARVIAWLAGEQWVLDVFNTHGKIYEATASQMFCVPLELIKKGNPEYELRQRGKVAQLACIAENELVSTDMGLVPIQYVTKSMRVWDGNWFVWHDGVVCNGKQAVTTYEGLTATPDHLVFPIGCDEPVHFADAANFGLKLRNTPAKPKRFGTPPKTVRVYDILNAGDLHRYTVSGVLVHNCGYQGAAGAMERMDTQHKIDPALYPELVEKWRAANPNIVALWDKIGRAALSCVQTGITQRTMRIVFEYVTTPNDQCYLTVALPSGRKLYYARPHLTKNRWDKPSLAYWGMDQTTKKWVVIETYGGKLVENIVQAIARDCLVVAMQRLEQAGYNIVMHIHDEVVIDATPDQTLDAVNAIMGRPIQWAEGLPLKAAGGEMPYYQKD